MLNSLFRKVVYRGKFSLYTEESKANFATIPATSQKEESRVQRKDIRTESQETLPTSTLKMWKTSGGCTHYYKYNYTPCMCKALINSTNPSIPFLHQKLYGRKAPPKQLGTRHTPCMSNNSYYPFSTKSLYSDTSTKTVENHSKLLGTGQSIGIQHPVHTHTPAVLLPSPLSPQKRRGYSYSQKFSPHKLGMSFWGLLLGR